MARRRSGPADSRVQPTYDGLPSWARLVVPNPTDVMPTVATTGLPRVTKKMFKGSALERFIARDPTAVPRGNPDDDLAATVKWLLDNEHVPDPKWWADKVKGGR